MRHCLRIVLAMSMLIAPAFARDLDGRYANSPLKSWFDKLASGKGLCCSMTDGYVVADADWETKDGHYRVRVPKVMGETETVWADVPDDAVITEPNLAGRTMVWPMYYGIEANGGPTIRCFMPGAEG